MSPSSRFRRWGRTFSTMRHGCAVHEMNSRSKSWDFHRDAWSGCRRRLWSLARVRAGRGKTVPDFFKSILLVAWCELRGHVDEGTGIGVFEHPQRAIGAFFHVADTVADVPALGGLGAAVSIEDDAVQRFCLHAADEAVAVPLREGLRAAVEHQVAGRDHGYPIDDRLSEVGPGVVTGNGHAVVVHAIRDERPAVILALLDQVQLVAAARAVLDFPKLARGRKRHAVGRADAAGPGFRWRPVGAVEGVGADDFGGLGDFGVAGGSEERRVGKECRS